MPRLARGGRQIHRANADIQANCDCISDEPCIHKIENYFRMNYGIPFIDHVISELDLQFSGKFLRFTMTSIALLISNLTAIKNKLTVMNYHTIRNLV